MLLEQIRAADWSNQPESTISSQLIMPVLHLLGYGEHTLHKVREQQSYTLADPSYNKGSRRVRLDYEPSVYEEGLWVMEAKGTDDEVNASTLGQVRDYAIHPEIRAALMVTVDRAGVCVYDPWDEHWDEPLVAVPPNDIADRLEELRAVLGVDRVPDFVRRRHFDHLKRALSASLELGVLDDAEQEFRELLNEARKSIDAKRQKLWRDARVEAEALHERVLEQSGVWGVAQSNNSPWVGSLRACDDFAKAVLAQDERQRPTQILQVKPAIEAVYQSRVCEEKERFRPLWWLSVVVMGGSLDLRGQPACEPYATEAARQAMRDCLLGYPDDDAAAASWRFQRVAIPLLLRIYGAGPLEEMAKEIRLRLSPENRIRYDPSPAWLVGHGLRIATINLLASVDPWTPEELDKRATEAAGDLDRLSALPPDPRIGPAGDPWLDSWKTTDPLLMCGLAVASSRPSGDELLDDELRQVILRSEDSESALLKRAGAAAVERLKGAGP